MIVFLFIPTLGRNTINLKWLQSNFWKPRLTWSWQDLKDSDRTLTITYQCNKESIQDNEKKTSLFWVWKPQAAAETLTQQKTCHPTLSALQFHALVQILVEVQNCYYIFYKGPVVRRSQCFSCCSRPAMVGGASTGWNSWHWQVFAEQLRWHCACEFLLTASWPISYQLLTFSPYSACLLHTIIMQMPA